jgi:hypothetical protein
LDCDLDVRDAASLRLWGEFPNEPGSQSGGDGRDNDHKREAGKPVTVRRGTSVIDELKAKRG